jgi:hypothetical protein
LATGKSLNLISEKKEIVYADWTAFGRAYQPIEEYIQKK